MPPKAANAANCELRAASGGLRASIPKRLRAIGLIVGERVVKSARPSRHAGDLTEWRLVNRPAAEAMRAALAAEQLVNDDSADGRCRAVRTATNKRGS